jgi:hypothetical protein
VKSGRLRCAGNATWNRKIKNAYRILVGNSLGNRPPGRQRRMWEDNIKMDVREMGCEDGRWMELALEHVQ